MSNNINNNNEIPNIKQEGMKLFEEFVTSGEKEKVKQIFMQELKEAGWYVELQKIIARILKQSKEVSSFKNLDEIINLVQEDATKNIPADVKARILSEIRKFCESKSKGI